MECFRSSEECSIWIKHDESLPQMPHVVWNPIISSCREILNFSVMLSAEIIQVALQMSGPSWKVVGMVPISVDHPSMATSQLRDLFALRCCSKSRRRLSVRLELQADWTTWGSTERSAPHHRKKGAVIRDAGTCHRITDKKHNDVKFDFLWVHRESPFFFP